MSLKSRNATKKETQRKKARKKLSGDRRSGIMCCTLIRSETAIRLLKSRLYELEIQKRNEKRDATEKGKKKIEWGSQIRNYVLHPYKIGNGYKTLEIEAL